MERGPGLERRGDGVGEAARRLQWDYMALPGSTYPVSRTVGACAATGRGFVAGERFVATLVELPDGSLERRDFSVEAWDQNQRPQGHLFAVWRATYQEPQPDKQPLLGDAELIDLFEQLGEATASRQIAFRYVLALLLIRRRLLRVVGSRPHGGDSPGALLVIQKGQDESTPTQVIDPGLDDAATAEVIEQLGQVLPGTQARG